MTNIGSFALVGAAAFTATVTRTTSVAIIVFELSGQLEYMPQTLASVLVAYGIGNFLSPSYFNLLLKLKKLPYLPALLNKNVYQKLAGHHYPKGCINQHFIKSSTTFLDALQVLFKPEIALYHEITVVQSHDRKVLKGSVRVGNLVKYLVKLVKDQQQIS